MTRSQNKSPQKRSRKPQRCTKCEDRPLRSECEHSASGLRFLAAKAHQEMVRTPLRRSQRSGPPHSDIASLSTVRDIHGQKQVPQSNKKIAHATEELPLPGRRCQICPEKPLRSQCKHTAKGRTYLAIESAKEIVNAIETSSSTNPLVTDDVFYDRQTLNPPSDQFTLPGLMLSPVPDDDTNNDTTVISSSPSLSSSVLDNDSNQNITVFSSSPTPRSSPKSSTSGAMSFIESKKRVKATGSNPIYGYIASVKRGNHPYQIYRTKPLPQPIENSRKASQRFSRLANKIIEKCESLSKETGAWLFFGAQHTSARGGALSYASPRICREAQVEVGELATDFNAVVSTLLRARRSDAVALQKRLEEITAARKVAEEEARRGAEQLAQYRERYGDLDLN